MKSKCTYCGKHGHIEKYCKKKLFIDKQHADDNESNDSVAMGLKEVIREIFKEQTQVAPLPAQAQAVYDLIGQTEAAMISLGKSGTNFQALLGVTIQQLRIVRNKLKGS